MPAPGELKVKVLSSDPELGDPQEFVFYLEPPYTDEQLDRKRREMVTLWVSTMENKGYDLKGNIRFRGPYHFFHDDRVDLGEKHQGEDEFQLKAMFMRRSPLIVGANVIEMWHEIRRSMGAPVYQPVRDGELVPSGRVRETQNDIFWKAGAS